jgi:glycosyltransferase involved in cell wall biosynthesis
MLYFYTAVYSDHIPLLEFPTKGFEFRCYTDRKIESKTWKIIEAPEEHGSPRMAAKWWKMFPPISDLGDVSIWIDASITVTDVHEMVRVCKAAISEHDVAFFKHPERTNVFDEAIASLQMPNKYGGLPLIAQVESYREEGLPQDSGLWAGGVIVRRHSLKRINFEDDWWEECKKWSYQDQLSLPYVLWKHDVQPGVIPGNVYKTFFHVWTPTADPVKPPTFTQEEAIALGEAFDDAASRAPTTENPLLSVITPTHNTKWLADCWASLKSQTYTNFEWLVSVNDAKGKREVMTKLAAEVRAIVGDDPRVKILQDHAPFSHVGQRKAYAFGMATGEVVIEYDHDDLLTPDALAEIAKAFSDPAVGFVYSDFADFDNTALDPNGKPIQGNLTYRHPQIRSGWITSGFEFYDANVLARVRPGKYECVHSPKPTARVVSHIYTAPNHVRAWRRSVYEAIGGHDSSFPIADDHELICRTYLATRFHHIEKPLYLYRISGENTWAQNVQTIKETSDRIQNDYLERLVLRECELLEVDAIELGGGIDPRAGWTAVDIEGAPIIADLRKKWPFEDGSVGAFRASDLLEHLPDKLHTMSEIHRCLRPGGWLISMTPSSEGWGAHADPTHVSYWNPMSFWYYTRDASARYIRNMTMRFAEVHLDTIPINIQGVTVPYVRADLVKL